MAKERIRLKFGVDQTVVEDLRALASSFSPYFDEVLELAEQGDVEGLDKLFENQSLAGRFTDAQKSSFKTRFRTIVDKLPSRPTALRKVIEQIKPEQEAVSPTETLELKKGAYEELGKLPRRTDTEIRDDLAKKIINIFGSQAEIANDPNKESIATQLADALLVGKNPIEEFQRITGLKGNIRENYAPVIEQLEKEIPEYIKHLRTETTDVSVDVKRLQDILSSRATEAEKQKALDDFLINAPEEARAEREEFITGQENLAGRQLQERILPRVKSELSRRGLLETPEELTGLLAKEGAVLQKNIEQQIIDLETADAQFFGEAAFRLTQAKIEKTENEFRQQQAFERAMIRQKQQQQFKISQSQQQYDFETKVLQDRYNRDLALQGQGLESGVDNLGAQSGLSIGKSIADVGTAYYLYGKGTQKEEKKESPKPMIV